MRDKADFSLGVILILLGCLTLGADILKDGDLSWFLLTIFFILCSAGSILVREGIKG